MALFTRANRGVRLTEAGEKLLESATRILRDVERTGDEIRAQDAHPSGRIILGITPTLCPILVPELFARMRREFPLVELKVMHAGMVRLEAFIIDGRVDVALLSELSRSRLISSTRLAQEEMVLVTRPGARPQHTISLEELSRTPLRPQRSAGRISGRSRARSAKARRAWAARSGMKAISPRV